jgi:hypothetical protein
MPNWCYNELTLSVKSDKQGKEILEAFAEGNPFQKIHPCPQELLDTVSGFYGKGTPEQVELERQSKENKEKYGHANWYDWSCSNWGTKWDVDTDVLDPLRLVNDRWTIRLVFDSAWSPPEGIYDYIHDNFPDVELDAYWEEPGIGQKGTYYAFQGTWDSTVEDWVDEDEDDIDLPVTQATPNVGAATVLPLPGGNKK